VHRFAGFALVLGVVLGVSCSRTSTLQRPEAVLSAYVDAIAEGDYRRAHTLLSAETRAAVTIETFTEHLGRDAGLTRLRVRALHRPPTAIGPDGALSLEGESVDMVLEAGGFRIVGNPADSFDQTTPRGAIRAFGFALAERRAEWLLGLAPPEARRLLDEATVRAALTEDNEVAYVELADAVTSSGETPIELHGSHASIRIGVRRVLRLIRYEGLWYVDGID